MKKLTIFLILILTYGCASFSQVTVQESVMSDGMKICATTVKDGKVCIVAEGQRYRHITWDGVTRTSKMIPREKRWVGMLGLKNSGYETWKYHNGITRANFSESQLHFSSESEAANNFKNGGFDEKNYVYSHDGLAVYFEKVVRPDMKAGGVIQLYVFQYMINGQKPNNLSGSHDDMISVEFNVRP